MNAFLGRLRIDPATMPPAVLDELRANDFEAIAAAQQDRPSLADILPSMTIPCLLYAGDADPIFPKTQESAKHIPHATFFALPELDHGAAHRESGLVLPHVTKFLREHS